MKASDILKKVPFVRYEEEEPKGTEKPPLTRVLDGEVTEEDKEEEDQNQFDDDLDRALYLLKDARDTLDFYSDFELSKGIILLKDRAELKKKVAKIDELLDEVMSETGDEPPDDITYQTIVIEDDPKPLAEHPTHCPKCGQKNIVDGEQLNAVYCPGVNSQTDWKGHYFVGLLEEIEFDTEMSSKERMIAERVLANVGLA